MKYCTVHSLLVLVECNCLCQIKKPYSPPFFNQSRLIADFYHLTHFCHRQGGEGGLDTPAFAPHWCK